MHILLKQTKQEGYKTDIVMGFTGGRTESSRAMTDQEAMLMIEHLENLQKGGSTAQPVIAYGGKRCGKTQGATETMKRKIISMAHECGWKMPGGKIDMNAVNSWCVKFGYLHKPLDDHTYQELPKLITQFESGPYLSHIKKIK